MNVTLAGLGEILAEEIMKSLRKRFETDDDRQIVGELYYEYLISKLEDEKESQAADAKDEIAALRRERDMHKANYDRVCRIKEEQSKVIRSQRTQLGRVRSAMGIRPSKPRR